MSTSSRIPSDSASNNLRYKSWKKKESTKKQRHVNRTKQLASVVEFSETTTTVCRQTIPIHNKQEYIPVGCVLPALGVSVQGVSVKEGGLCPGVSLSGGICVQGEGLCQVDPSPTPCGQTDTYEIITLPQNENERN